MCTINKGLTKKWNFSLALISVESFNLLPYNPPGVFKMIFYLTENTTQSPVHSSLIVFQFPLFWVPGLASHVPAIQIRTSHILSNSCIITYPVLLPVMAFFHFLDLLNWPKSESAFRTQVMPTKNLSGAWHFDYLRHLTFQLFQHQQPIFSFSVHQLGILEFNSVWSGRHYLESLSGPTSLRAQFHRLLPIQIPVLNLGLTSFWLSSRQLGIPSISINS